MLRAGVLGRWLRAGLAAVLVVGLNGVATAQAPALGSSVQTLLDYARTQSPELAAMRQEAEAAAHRVVPAGALPDPVLRVELMNLNNYGNDASPSLLPWRVGETRYTLMQMLPGAGKRDLRREVAAADALQAEARSAMAWSDLSMRIKTAYAEYYGSVGRERLTQEVLDLMAHLEQVAQARYAGGLAVQQDAVRAQLEQTALRAELIALGVEVARLRARLNGLLGRDPGSALAEPQGLRALPGLTSANTVELAERARRNNPELRVELARLASARKSSELVVRDRYPDFQVGVAPTQMRSRLTSWSLMLEVNLPLQQESRRWREREAQTMVTAARSRSEAIGSQLLGDLAGALAGLDAARRTEDLISTQLQAQAELGLRSAYAAYENGKVDFATLLEAQRLTTKVKQDALAVRVEAQRRLAEIERIMGEDS